MPTTTTIQAVWTSGAKIQAANLVGTGAALPAITTFKVGLGGYYADGAIRPPDPNLTDLDIIINPSRYPDYPNPPYTTRYYTGSVGAFTVNTVSMVVPCTLLVTDYNSDGVGFPYIREVGLFDALGTMVVYGTFGGIRKNPTKQVDLNLELFF